MTLRYLNLTVPYLTEYSLTHLTLTNLVALTELYLTLGLPNPPPLRYPHSLARVGNLKELRTKFLFVNVFNFQERMFPRFRIPWQSANIRFPQNY